MYSATLLQAALDDPGWVRTLERQLASFLADSSLRRQALDPMPRHQRQLVHELAAQYGLTTHAYKPEPHRYVELFKPATASVPNKCGPLQ